MKRIDKENYYLDIAETVLERSTCLRRCYGAIIVKNDEIVSTGYNGAPRGRKNCMDLGYCTREAMNVPSGERYELCRSVHAEMNALIQCAKEGISTKNTEIYVTHFPCINCTKALLQAGVVKITYKANYRPHAFAIELMEQKGVSYVQHDVPEVHLGMDD